MSVLVPTLSKAKQLSLYKWEMIINEGEGLWKDHFRFDPLLYSLKGYCGLCEFYYDTSPHSDSPYNCIDCPLNDEGIVCCKEYTAWSDASDNFKKTKELDYLKEAKEQAEKLLQRIKDIKEG